jgi:pseudaminic acid biosynthesis-associated methylase
VAARTALFGKILARTSGIRSVIELGANIGNNLKALRALLPNAELVGVEINPTACTHLAGIRGVTAFNASLLDFRPSEPADLSFTAGVLIHQAPDALPRAYESLVNASLRYVLIAEYYNPSPVELPYRGHAGKLFKRDFAGEMLDAYALRLLDYGFVYRRDPMFPGDDLTWFLMEKH